MCEETTTWVLIRNKTKQNKTVDSSNKSTKNRHTPTSVPGDGPGWLGPAPPRTPPPLTPARLWRRGSALALPRRLVVLVAVILGGCEVNHFALLGRRLLLACCWRSRPGLAPRPGSRCASAGQSIQPLDLEHNPRHSRFPIQFLDLDIRIFLVVVIFVKLDPEGVTVSLRRRWPGRHVTGDSALTSGCFFFD